MTMLRAPSSEETRALLQRAINICGGTQQALAAACSYSQNGIWLALKKGRISLEMAVALDRATKGQVPSWQTRPDAFSVNAPSSPSLDDTAVRAAGSSPGPNPETVELPLPARGSADPVVTPAPTGG